MSDAGGTWFTAFVEAGASDYSNNVLYASETTPEQWRLEEALTGALAGDGDVARAGNAYLDRLRREPQRSFHFGIRYPTLDALEATLAEVDAAGRDGPDLAGRVAVTGVFRSGDPGAITDIMVQAFVRTDVVATGLLAFGQHVELQWQLPADR